MQTIEPIARAVEAFAGLPGIGPKTAQRLAFHLLRQPPETVRDLAEAILHMKEAVHFCSVCGNVTDVEPCSICRSDQRDRNRPLPNVPHDAPPPLGCMGSQLFASGGPSKLAGTPF